MKLQIHNENRPGITLVEILAVVAVIGILAAVAVPNLARMAPYAELRNETRYLATAMREARLKAANSHKPVRVVLDCSRRDSPVCTLRSYAAIFEDDPDAPAESGRFRGWAAMPSENAVHELAASVTVLPNADLNQGLGAKVTTDQNIFWAVFLPEGRMLGSHAPFRLLLASEGNTRRRVLEVNGATGRAVAHDDENP
jgi:prepilin-type N-terminal cleavage/methylation domain-containing protein